MKRLIATLLALAASLCCLGCAKVEVSPTPTPTPTTTPDMSESVSVLTVFDEEERAFLESFHDDMPVIMTVWRDQHYPEAVVFDQQVMLEMYDAFCDISVIGKSDISSTDGYHRLTFVTADGKRVYIRFEHSTLDMGDALYDLTDAGRFWSLFNTIAENGWEEAQANAERLKQHQITYAEPDMGVLCDCSSVTFEKDGDWLDVSAELTFTNNGSAPLTFVALSVSLTNYENYVVDESSALADFSAQPIDLGETRQYSYKRRIYDLSDARSDGGIPIDALVNVLSAAF